MNRHQRRGISPIIATIILIALTIFGGVVVWSIFSSSSGTAGAQVQLQDTGKQLTVSNNAATLVVNLKNTGNKPIKGLSNVTWDNTNTRFRSSQSGDVNGTYNPAPTSGSPLLPGQQAVLTLSITSGTLPTVGKTYSFTITATASDGSVYSLVVSVQATSS